MMTELGEFAAWLVTYAAQPLDKEFVALAEQKKLPASTLLTLGHGMAITAITSKVAELFRRRDVSL